MLVNWNKKMETQFEPLWVGLVALLYIYVSHWHESASPVEYVIFNVWLQDWWCGLIITTWNGLSYLNVAHILYDSSKDGEECFLEWFL